MPIEAKTLKGFRDFLPDTMAPRQAMIRAIEATFERHGFQPLMTPALEYLETLMGKYGEEGDKLLYRFEDHGGRQVALRYDLTVPLARVVAQHRNLLQLPLRRYQIAPVWRADKPQRGRFREFMQCDADLAGVNSAVADAEVLVTGLAVLRALGIEDARLHLNHRDVLRALLAACGIHGDVAQLGCIRAIDKLDKVGREGVEKDLAQLPELDAHLATHVMDLFAGGLALPDLEARVVLALGDHPTSHETVPQAREAFSRVRTVVELVEAAGFPGKIAFDPTIARGLDYYTGIIYETRLTNPKVAGIGAVMSGGRYDGLIGMFGKEQVPAVGISLGLDRLLAALQELGLVQAQAGPPVYVTVFAAELAVESVKLAQVLRATGLAVELDAAGGKLGKQFERAGKRGCLVALVIGPDEAREHAVVVKDLRAQTQERIGQDQLSARVQALLAS